MRTLGRHMLSVASLLWLCINLLLSVSCLLALAILKLLLPIATIQSSLDATIEALYRWAVTVDSLWIKYVLNITIDIQGTENSHPAPVIICNHHCGFDVAILQEIVSRRGPLLKFLIKRELLYLPIVGWICLLLDFPRLNRSKEKQAREEDSITVKTASKEHGISRREYSGALLIFPEGTRFSPKKQSAQGSPYQHLLKPKSGGLKIIHQYVEKNTPILDITLDYGAGALDRSSVNLWSCLHGKPNKIGVRIEQFNMSEIDDIEQWLNQRWLEKDRLLQHSVKISR